MTFTQDRPSADDLPLLASDRSRDSTGHLLMTCQYWLPTDLVFPVCPLALLVLNRAIEILWCEKKKTIDAPE
ncbi:13615_t:CDS:2 [Acaulospora morrowiae]|uniref:13615_t:CDS:1 n=1 Tax=Acaulospora morrowiae TaxID=94023 RepID=A0A9N8WMY6_9GLOM|nr:13615_t:CDS:2 [Acaulospora morrowiae]